MGYGRRTTDWLIEGAARVDGSGDRRAADRRGPDRRAPRRRIDPLFAATLLNQILPAATASGAYAAPLHAVGAGRLTDIRA